MTPLQRGILHSCGDAMAGLVKTRVGTERASPAREGPSKPVAMA